MWVSVRQVRRGLCAGGGRGVSDLLRVSCLVGLELVGASAPRRPLTPRHRVARATAPAQLSPSPSPRPILFPPSMSNRPPGIPPSPRFRAGTAHGPGCRVPTKQTLLQQALFTEHFSLPRLSKVQDERPDRLEGRAGPHARPAGLDQEPLRGQPGRGEVCGQGGDRDGGRE